MRRMRTSKAGLNLIKSFEGYRPRAEQLPSGEWSIGYSHTQSARKNLRVTQADAEAVLREYDLPPIERLIGGSVLAPLNQNQFDALVSFTFNIGAEAFENSEVLSFLNMGSDLAAADAMMKWRRARVRGKVIVVDALVRRRAMEHALFLKHPGGPPVAPTGIVRPINSDQSTLSDYREPRRQASPVRRAQPSLNQPVEAEHGSPPEPVHAKPPVDAPEHEGPTPDEITRAISALANPDKEDQPAADVPLDMPQSDVDDSSEPLILFDGQDLPPPPFVEEHGLTLEDKSDASQTDEETPGAYNPSAGSAASEKPEPMSTKANGKLIIDDLETVEADPLLLQQAESIAKEVAAIGTPAVRGSTFILTSIGLIGIGLASVSAWFLKANDGDQTVSNIEQYFNFGGLVFGVFLIGMALLFLMRRRGS